MLLSVERPFVGAFAFHIPRATLLHFMVLCKQSCRRRLNMCKRALGFSRNWGGPVFSSMRSRPENRVTNSRLCRRTRPPGSELNE